MQANMPWTACATWPPSRICLKSATGSAVDTCSGSANLSGIYVLSGQTQQLLQIAENAGEFLLCILGCQGSTWARPPSF